MAHHYGGLDLRDLWRPGGGASRLTYRRLRVLIDGLPPESRLKTELRDGLTQDEWDDLPQPDGHGPWSRTDHLLAAVWDQLGWLIYTVAAANGGKPEEPSPMPRPGVGRIVSAAEREAEAVAEARRLAFLRHLRAHGGQAPPPGWDWQTEPLD